MIVTERIAELDSCIIIRKRGKMTLLAMPLLRDMGIRCRARSVVVGGFLDVLTRSILTFEKLTGTIHFALLHDSMRRTVVRRNAALTLQDALEMAEASGRTLEDADGATGTREAFYFRE